MRLELILDRIEEDRFAVLTDEDRGVYLCDVSLLPLGADEGDAFFGIIDGDGRISSLEMRTNVRAGENKRRLRALFDKFKN